GPRAEIGCWDYSWACRSSPVLGSSRILAGSSAWLWFAWAWERLPGNFIGVYERQSRPDNAEGQPAVVRTRSADDDPPFLHKTRLNHRSRLRAHYALLPCCWCGETEPILNCTPMISPRRRN